MMIDKNQIRMTGAMRILSGIGGLTAAVCFGSLGWWIAAPLVGIGLYRLITGIGLVMTGRPVVDVD